MYSINTLGVTTDARTAALIPQGQWSHVAEAGIKPRVAPLCTMAAGSKSAFGTVGSTAFGALVITDAGVRDAKQAAPPRGQRC